MPGKQTYAFTIREQERVNALFSKVQISESFDPDAFAPSPQARSYVAVWDTGATHSSISQRIVEDLGLAPSGKARVRVIGPKGGEGQSTYQSDTYLVSIVLPNKVAVIGVRVAEGEMEEGEEDIIIGMDIIGQGDFAVTHKNGTTTWSFQYPSYTDIDFTTPNAMSSEETR